MAATSSSVRLRDETVARTVCVLRQLRFSPPSTQLFLSKISLTYCDTCLYHVLTCLQPPCNQQAPCVCSSSSTASPTPPSC